MPKLEDFQTETLLDLIISLTKRIEALEKTPRLEDLHKIEIVELEPGFAPKNKYATDAGHDIKIRPTQSTSTKAIANLGLYLNPESYGVTIEDLCDLYVDGERIALNDMDIPKREEFVSNLLQKCLTTNVAYLASCTDLESKTTTVGTGFKIALPDLSVIPGWTSMLMIAPRSGLAITKGVQITNTPGIIDCEFRDEIVLALTNTRECVHYFTKGARLAQGIIIPCINLNNDNTTIVTELSITDRGLKGIGSTGI